MDEGANEEVGSSRTARDGGEAVSPLLQNPSEEQGGSEEVTPVARPVPGYRDDWSIFPPKEHEDLYVQHEASVREPPSSCLGASDYASSELGPRSLSLSPWFYRWSGDRALWERRVLAERMRFAGLVRRLVDWGSGLFRSRDLTCTTMGVGRRLGDGFWSITAFSVVALVLLYMRRKHRQERFRLLLVIHEKDKMIAQLLQKIVQMNGRTSDDIPSVTLN